MGAAAMNAAMSYDNMAANAAEAAGLLKLLANEKRLLVLCRLAELGEAPVGALAGDVGLSQSALSQHLARLREDGLVAPRREAQTVLYRIADPRAEQVLATLHAIFCAPAPRRSRSRPVSPSGSRKSS